MATDRLFETRLHRVRRDFEPLRHGMRSLAAHVRAMRASSDSWSSAIDALQLHLADSMREATALAKELSRVVAEAQSLIAQAPRADRSLRVGQKPTSATSVRSELGGKIRRLQRDAAALDRELRAYHARVQRMVDDPMRHAAGQDPVDALSDLIGRVGAIVQIARGFLDRNRR